MAETMTITRALAEIKTLGKRVESKKQFIARYFFRDERLKDPLSKDGGTVAVVAREWQAMDDLHKRLVDIRCAIQGANLRESLTVCGVTRTVSEWLNWRREVSSGVKDFIHGLLSSVTRVRRKVLEDAAQGGRSVVKNEAVEVPEVAFAMPESELAAKAEALEEILGTLDGELSQFNATVSIELP